MVDKNNVKESNLDIYWPRSRCTPLLILAGAVAIFGSALPMGYNIGVINTPANIIQQFCNKSIRAHYGVDISESSLEVLWASIVSIFLIGGMTGSLSGGVLADKYGRKVVTIVCSFLGLITALLFVTCKYANSIEILIFARLVVGFSSGLVTSTVPMYLTEIAPLNLRGAMGVICPLGITSGVLLAQFLGLHWILGTEETWQELLGIYGLFILITALILPTLPESPKYLYIVRKQEERAVKELSRIRKLPKEQLTKEIQMLQQATTSKEENNEEWTVKRVLQSNELRLPLILVCSMQGGQQCIGINAVFYYSTTIFENAGLSYETAQYANLGAGFVNFLVSIFAIPLCNNCGRRVLILMSLYASGIFLILLGVFIYITHVTTWMPYLAVITLYLFVLFFGFGVAPVPYFIGAELFDVGPRPIGMAFGSAANWSGNFLVGMLFPLILSFIGPSVFFIHAAISFGLAIFFCLYLPETKGSDPAEIAEMLKDGFKSKIRKSVPKKEVKFNDKSEIIIINN